MTGISSIPIVEAMKDPLKPSKRTALRLRACGTFIVVVYRRMPELKHLPAHQLAPPSAS
jgi:hypothetical protein